MSKIYSTIENLPEEGVEVIGFNPEWIDEDFNPNGTRACTYFDECWISAKWNDYSDSYNSRDSESPTHWCLVPSFKKVINSKPLKTEIERFEVKKLSDLPKNILDSFNNYFYDEDDADYKPSFNGLMEFIMQGKTIIAGKKKGDHLYDEYELTVDNIKLNLCTSQYIKDQFICDREINGIYYTIL